MIDHPLDAARKRVERSDIYLNELLSALEQAGREYQESIIIDHDEVSNQPNIRIPIPKLIPWEIPFAIGDFVHNLRIALEYLVFELSKVDSGDPAPERTQFPLCQRKKDFDGIRSAQAKRKGPLAYLTDAHVDAIDLYQPYKGIKWSETLRAISNEDKHKSITVVSGRRAVQITDGIGEVLKGVGRGRADVKMERKTTVSISLANGDPVIETLEILKREVSLVIDSFSPEFKV